MRRITAFIALWAAILTVAALCFAFPTVVAAIIVVSCLVMLLIITWNFVVMYIDE